MADNESTSTVKITATDNTAAGIASAKKNFASLPKEIQAQYKMLDNGTAISLREVEGRAKRMRRSFEEELKITTDRAKSMVYINKKVDETGKAHDRAGRAADNAGGRAGRAGQKHVTAAQATANAVGKMALQYWTLDKAIQAVTQSYTAYAKHDEQMKLMKLANNVGNVQMKEFSENIKSVARITQTETAAMGNAFKILKDSANLSLAETQKILPELGIQARGMGVIPEKLAKIQADTMRNFKIGPEKATESLEILSAAHRQLNVDVNKLAGSRAAQSMANWGYEGIAGQKAMLAFISSLNETTGDTADSVSMLGSMFERLESQHFGDILGYQGNELAKGLKEAAERGEDVGAIVTGLIDKVMNKEELWSKMSRQERVAWKQFHKDWQGGMAERIKVLDKAAKLQEGHKAGEEMMKGPMAEINRMTVLVGQLASAFGELLDAFGATVLLSAFNDLINTLRKDIEWIAGAWKSITRGGKMPSYYTKEELAEKNKHGFWGGFPGASAFRGNKEDAESKPEEKPGSSSEAPVYVRPAERLRQEQMENLRSSGSPKGERVRYIQGQMIDSSRRMASGFQNASFGGATEFSSRGRGQFDEVSGQNIVTTAFDKAGGEGDDFYPKAGGGGGGAYGSSSDVKYLQANYSPGGGGNLGGYGGNAGGFGPGSQYEPAGPGGYGLGTGYGHGPGVRTKPGESAGTDSTRYGPGGVEVQPGTIAPVLPPELGGPKPSAVGGTGIPASTRRGTGDDVKLAPGEAPFVSPVQSGKIISVRGDSRGGGKRLHKGTDFGAKTGTPITAVNDQTVTEAGWIGTNYGWGVKAIDAQGREHVYSHMAPGTIPKGLKKGDPIGPGTVIGGVGQSGNARDTPPHLHYETRPKKGAYDNSLNPLSAFNLAPGQSGVAASQPGSAPMSAQGPAQALPPELGGPTAPTASAGGTASGDYQGRRVNADVLKTRIQQSNAEWMKDPKNQQKIFRTLQAEGGGNIAANLEQMSNYAASRGKTLEQVVNARGSKQFYGPLRRFHGDPGSGQLMKHERDAYFSQWTPAKQKAWDKASNEVFSGGSNRINYATDQGTVGDPNYNPNTMTNVGGNMFGVQPGTGKWVSAQRGKPQVSGPVAVAGAPASIDSQPKGEGAVQQEARENPVSPQLGGRNEVDKAVQVNLKVNQNDVQFARRGLERQIDGASRRAADTSYYDPTYS